MGKIETLQAEVTKTTEYLVSAFRDKSALLPAVEHRCFNLADAIAHVSQTANPPLIKEQLVTLIHNGNVEVTKTQAESGPMHYWTIREIPSQFVGARAPETPKLEEKPKTPAPMTFKTFRIFLEYLETLTAEGYNDVEFQMPDGLAIASWSVEVNNEKHVTVTVSDSEN